MNSFKSVVALSSLLIISQAGADQTRSLAEIKKLEEQSTVVTQLLNGGDVSAYWSRHIARHMRTALVPRRQATRALEKIGRAHV